MTTLEIIQAHIEADPRPTLHPKYAVWIAQHGPDTQQAAMGQCKEYSEKMQQAFPKLRLVRGHYNCAIWGRREHWWLTDGMTTIDPTVQQFPGPGTYHELSADAEEPIGKCMQCGEYCFRSKDGTQYACGPECERKLDEYYNGSRPTDMAKGRA